MESHGQGWTELFRYGAKELDEALDRHHQLTKNFGDGTCVVLQKLAGFYGAEVRRPDRPDAYVEAGSLTVLMQRLRAELEGTAGGTEE